jgi:hypothetical protein
MAGFVIVCTICLLSASTIRHFLIEPAMMNQQCLATNLARDFACTVRSLAIMFINLPLLPYTPLAVLLLTLKWPNYGAILIAAAIASFGLILYHPEPSSLAIILAGFLLVGASRNTSSPGKDITNQSTNSPSA